MGHGLLRSPGCPSYTVYFSAVSKAGVQRWIVLVQHEAQWVRSSLATTYKLRDIAWQVYDLPTTEPEQLAAAFPAEDVLLVTVPAVFDYRLLADLQDALAPTLCVTTAAAPTPADIVVHDGRIVTGATQGAPAYRSTGILRCSGTQVGQVLSQAWAQVRQSPSGPHRPPDQAARPDSSAGAGCQPASMAPDHGTAGYQRGDGRGTLTPEPGARGR